jgi:hypothetical protein
MPADNPDDREPHRVGGSGDQPNGHGRGGMPRWLGRRRTLTVVVLLGLLAAAGFGLRQVRQDPIRYGLDFPPLVDGADYGEAYLVKQLRRGVERTAGPYIGPNPNLSDVVGALNLKTSGPTGQPTFSEVLSSTVTQGHDFTGQAEALVRLCFHSAGWLLPSESGPRIDRCRLVKVRYDDGRIRFTSRRAICPRGSGPPGPVCRR